MKTAPIARQDPLREKICYYVDDGNIPEEVHERIAYLGTSRNYLGRLIVKGSQYLKERHLDYDFKEWLRHQGGC